MNLYLFPAPAGDKGGYDIAVKDAYEKLQPQNEDVIVWACLVKPECAKDKDYVVYYKPFKSKHTIYKLMTGSLNNEFSVKDLSFLEGLSFDNIHCDDVVFYRAIRKLYPQKQITVRFHNVFSRIFERVNMLSLKSDWRYRGKMYLTRFLESEIFNDPLVYKVFLTDEDATYYKLITGNKDFEVWKMTIEKNPKSYETIRQIVWFGGIEGHKKASVDWFVKTIWPDIFKTFPKLELHLFGSYTNQYKNPRLNIFGHGFYNGNELPYLQSGLYINPDVMGGGIKIKVLSYFKEGVRFISTPFGYEGYDNQHVDNYQCFVIPCQEWKSKIIELIKLSNKK